MQLSNLSLALTRIGKVPLSGTYYVSAAGSDAGSGSLASPFATLAHAASVAASGSTINLRSAGGTIYETATTTVSGRTLTIQAYQSETPVVSGGVVLGAWTLFDAGNGIWRTPALGTAARTLWVNGVRSSIVRSSAAFSGITKTATGYTFAVTNPIVAYARPQDVEMVYRVSWTQSLVKVASTAGLTITMTDPAFTFGQTTSAPINLPTFWQNAYELLSSSTPGQFYYDAGAGYYYYVPRSTEDLSTAVVIAPSLQQILILSGCSNVTLTGITFQHTNWIPSGFAICGGHISVQSNAYRTTSALPAVLGAFPKILPAVQATGCTGLSMTGCKVQKTHGAGLSVEGGSSSCTVQGNTVSDTGANGIDIGDPQEAFANPFTTGITVKDNYVTLWGQEYPDSCGIFAPFCKNPTITQNDIRYGPYTGISIGWGWGDASASPTQNGGGTVSNNSVRGAMQTMSDGGFIYCNSYFTSLTVSGNIFFDMTATAQGGMIYTDDGSKNITLSGNAVFYNAATVSNFLSFYTHSTNLATDSITVTGNYFQYAAFQNQGGAISLPGNTTSLPDYTTLIKLAGLESGYASLAPTDPVRFLPAAWIAADLGTYQTVSGTAATANNDPVGSWLDQSLLGKDFAQATAGKRGLLKTAYQNSLPVVLFDGTDDSIAWPNPGGQSQPISYYLVGNLLVGTNQSALISDNSVGNDEMAQGTPNGFRCYGGSAFVTYGALAAASFYTYQCTFSGASTTISVNGGAKTTGSGGTATSSGIKLAQSGDNARPANLAAGELLAFFSTPDATLEADVIAYLKARWAHY